MQSDEKVAQAVSKRAAGAIVKRCQKRWMSKAMDVKGKRCHRQWISKANAPQEDSKQDVRSKIERDSSNTIPDVQRVLHKVFKDRACQES